MPAVLMYILVFRTEWLWVENCQDKYCIAENLRYILEFRQYLMAYFYMGYTAYMRNSSQKWKYTPSFFSSGSPKNIRGVDVEQIGTFTG